MRPLGCGGLKRPNPQSLATRLTRRAFRARREERDCDLAIEAVMRTVPVEDLNDPGGFAGFLRECFGAVRFGVVDDSSANQTDNPSSLRFASLLDRLREGTGPVPAADAVRIAHVADRLLADTTPFDRPERSIDAGVHARMASSFGRKGRLLRDVVRLMRCERVVELGTAYGMASLFVASSLSASGRLVTIEQSRPQVDIARSIFDETGDDSIELIEGAGVVVVDQVQARLDSIDFLFHDAAHDARAYVEDFKAFEPLLAPGAVVIFDDIRWAGAHAGASESTYSGWMAVRRHPRVRRSVELDGELGLLLLH